MSPRDERPAADLGQSEPITIHIPDDVSPVALLGPADDVLRSLERNFPSLAIHVRGNEMRVQGPAGDVDSFAGVLKELFDAVRGGQELNSESVERALSIMRAMGLSADKVMTAQVLSHRGKTIRAKTPRQRDYVDAMDANTITFGIGPAGTGKTYLAMAKAVHALHSKQVSRIILTRPAVEAGERLGFLPGSLTEKIDPYLRPLLDALHDMVDVETIPKLMSSGVIEVAPLAYMRGRTLNEAFVILDEAQNTTAEQMKMFLTRLGFGSKMVVTGDATQIDLPGGAQSGLKAASSILADIEDIAFCHLTSEDVVRHRLVGDIVAAYDRASASAGSRSHA